MEIEIIELIILMNGSFVPVKIPAERKAYFNDLLAQATSPDAPKGVLLSLGDDYRLITSAIVGWYFRPVIVNQAEKIVKLIEKQVNKESGDDSWKDTE